MSIKITKTTCPFCHRTVELNGAGSTANMWQTGLTKLLATIYPITVKTFRPATDQHDLDYHIGPKVGHDKEQVRQLKDFAFLQNCHKAINESNRNAFMKSWLRYQAEKFYNALRLGGGAVFPHYHCTDIRRKELADKEEREFLLRYEGIKNNAN